MRRILFMPFCLLTILCFGQHTDSLQLDLKPILENSAPVCGLVSPLPQTASFQAILEGKVEGPVIRMGCNMGRVATLNYRPLYVLDGRVIKAQEFTDLDPNDFEIVNILKGDAATKKYGEATSIVVEMRSKPGHILYVVDGQVTAAEDLKGYDPACIEEIIVLKKSGSVGCRPGKTVIVITTKTVLF